MESELLTHLKELFALCVLPENFTERKRQRMLTRARAAIAKCEDATTEDDAYDRYQKGCEAIRKQRGYDNPTP